MSDSSSEFVSLPVEELNCLFEQHSEMKTEIAQLR
jgi:hypothetical protein